MRGIVKLGVQIQKRLNISARNSVIPDFGCTIRHLTCVKIICGFTP